MEFSLGVVHQAANGYPSSAHLAFRSAHAQAWPREAGPARVRNRPAVDRPADHRPGRGRNPRARSPSRRRVAASAASIPGAPGSGHGTVPRPDEGHFLAAWSWRLRDSPSVGVRGGSWSAPRDAGRPHAPARALRARGVDLPPPWSDPAAGRGLFSATRGSSSAVLPERIWPVLEGAYAGAAGALCLVVTGSNKARRRRRELRGDGCRSPAEARFLRPRAVGRYVR